MSDGSLLFLVINMSKNADRWRRMEAALNDINKHSRCDYIRIEGVDGRNMSDDSFTRKLLKPRKSLAGKTLCCLESGESWTYDGSISRSFPGLHLNGHWGYKGLTLSNMKCFFAAKSMAAAGECYNWYCVLEDDAELDMDVYKKIRGVINLNRDRDDVIPLDRRGLGDVGMRGQCGAAGVLYNRRIIDHVIGHMHPLSHFSIMNEKNFSKRTNLWDWKLHAYITAFGVRHSIHTIIPSGSQGSTIS